MVTQPTLFPCCCCLQNLFGGFPQRLLKKNLQVDTCPAFSGMLKGMEGDIPWGKGHEPFTAICSPMMHYEKRLLIFFCRYGVFPWVCRNVHLRILCSPSRFSYVLGGGHSWLLDMMWLSFNLLYNTLRASGRKWSLKNKHINKWLPCFSSGIPSQIFPTSSLGIFSILRLAERLLESSRAFWNRTVKISYNKYATQSHFGSCEKLQSTHLDNQYSLCRPLTMMASHNFLYLKLEICWFKEKCGCTAQTEKKAKQDRENNFICLMKECFVNRLILQTYAVSYVSKGHNWKMCRNS